MDSPVSGSPELTLENYSWVVKALRASFDTSKHPSHDDSGSSRSDPSSTSLPISSTIPETTSESSLLPNDALLHPSLGDGTNDVPGRRLDCGICQDSFAPGELVILPTCDHPFCYDCLRSHTVTKLQEGRFPILCPLCSLDKQLSHPSQISQSQLVEFGLSQSNFDRFVELEMLEIAVSLKCLKCKRSMLVDRKEYSALRLISCPLPACGQRWCKDCGKVVDDSTTKHRCKDKTLNRVMKKKGWRYCPGCLSPVEKSEGCNHITCRAPGCNVHFCYLCGDSIIDTTHGGDVGMAVTNHGSECRGRKRKIRLGKTCVVQ